MLSRFYNTSCKIVRLAHILNTNKCHSVSALGLLQQKCQYTTADHQSINLELAVKQLNDRVENQSCLSSDDLNSLLMKVKSVKKVESSQALEILRLCSFLRIDENQSDIVNSIWNELKKEKANFQIQHYNCILLLARNNPDIEQLQVIFDELLKDGIKLDAISYQCLLSAYNKSGNIKKAIEILQMMRADKLHINEALYNNMVQCHIICGDIEAALDAIKKLKSNGYKLDCYTIEILLIQYAKGSDLENIQKTFEMFRKENWDLLKGEMLQPTQSSAEEINRRLLTLLQKRSGIVLENVFKELFELSAKKGVNVVLDVVNLMCTDFGIQPLIPFVLDNILPSLNVNENPNLAFTHLQTTKIRDRSVIVAIIMHSLDKNDFKTAYEFATTHKNFYAIELIKIPLLKAFANTKHISNFVSFVRVMYESFAHINNYSREKVYSQEEIEQKQIDFIGDILYSIIVQRRYASVYIQQLLDAFIAEGLVISVSQANKIQNNLKVDDQKPIIRLLKKLSTEPLKLKPFQIQKELLNVSNNELSSAEVKSILDVKLTKDLPEHSIIAAKKRLFLAYLREENIAEIETLMANDTFNITEANYTSLIELYTRNCTLGIALDMLERACKDKPFFKLNPTRLAKLLVLMIEKERNFNEIEALLRKHRRDKYEFYNHTFEHILDRLAKSGKAELVEKLFEALVKYKFIEPTVKSSAPLVKAHLTNGAHAKAVAKYEYIANNYKIVIMTKVLFRHLIQNNEMDLLQRAVDGLKKIHGESIALFRLAFAYVECEQVQPAKDIFEKGQIRNLSTEISKECKTLGIYKSVETAKTLLKATKGINCNRHEIYQTLLDIYHQQNNGQEAMDLWIEYSNEGISPNQTFKNELVELLKANNMEIPFDLKKS